MLRQLVELVRLPVPTASRRDFVILVVELAAFVALSCGLSVWVGLGVLENDKRHRDFANAEATRAFGALRDAYELVDRRLAAAEKIGLEGDADVSQTSSEDPRFAVIQQADAFKIAYYDGIRSFLLAPHGPTEQIKLLNRQTRLPELVWQLPRGLPIRLDGRLMARHQRAEATRTERELPDIVATSVVDAEGRVVFVSPYSLQIEVPSFFATDFISGLSEILKTRKPNLLRHETFIGSQPGPFISFATPSGRDRWVIVTSSLSKPHLVDPNSAMTGIYTDDGRTLLSRSTTGSPEGSTRIALQIRAERYWVSVRAAKPELAANVIGRIAILACVTVGFCWVFGRQFGHLLIRADRASEKIQRAEQLVAAKAQDLAHDFRNTVLALRALTDSATPELKPEHLQSLLGHISNLQGYVVHLSTRLARESLGDRGRTPVEASTYIRGAIDTAVKQYARQLRGAKIRVKLDETDQAGEPFVAVPGRDLDRILLNLVSNAVDACSGVEAPRITVEIVRADVNVLIRVMDNGVGISQSDRNRLFRGSFTTKGNGHGKGLSVARDLAESYGGSVRLLPLEAGAGTIFEVTLPSGETPAWFANSLTLTEKTVLVVVDDEPVAVEHWKKALDERLGPMNLARPTIAVVDSPTALRAQPELISNGTIFLVDQQFLNDSMTGLQLIEEMKLGNRALLVTNHFENTLVLEEATRLGVKILPKTDVLSTRFTVILGADND